MSISNIIAGKFMGKFDGLVDLCIQTDIERNYNWKSSVAIYKDLIELAGQREDFTDEEIELFQDKADDFFMYWKDLHNEDGITNYIHMLGSGHFKHFLTQHRNLYAFSQQGWESLNSLIKQFYFRRTQQGGFGGSTDSEPSKIIPHCGRLQTKTMNTNYKAALHKYTQSGTHDHNFYAFCNGKIETYYLCKWLDMRPNLTAAMEAELPDECALSSEGTVTGSSTPSVSSVKKNKRVGKVIDAIREYKSSRMSDEVTKQKLLYMQTEEIRREQEERRQQKEELRLEAEHEQKKEKGKKKGTRT